MSNVINFLHVIVTKRSDIFVQAYAGFYWTALALKVEGSKSMETFETNMKLFCSKDWKTVSIDQLHNHDGQENIDWEK